MEVSIEGTRSKLLLILATGLSAAILWQAGCFWLARHRFESGQIPLLQSSAALVPGNGETWDRLGRLQQWDLANADLPLAIEDFRKAVNVDPLSSGNWMDLASALEENEDEAGARAAYERAQSVYPKSAQVAFNYGNFLLRQDDPADGFRQLRQAAQSDPRLLPLIVSRAWRSTEDVNQLLDQVLPQNADAYLQALDFFRSIHQGEPALAVWERLVAAKERFPLRRSFPLIDELIDEDRSSDARRVWREALVAAALPYGDPPQHSLVWNGNLRADFANGGLDWRWWPISGMLMDFDSEPGPNGSRAVRLDFSGGANLALAVPFEFVPVEPNTAYRFHAYLRTNQITTESGVRFQIEDPNHAKAVDIVTENFVGSHAWSSVDADVMTGPQTHFLVIRVVRYMSRLFDNQLGGTAWMSDVSLTPASSPQAAAAR